MRVLVTGASGNLGSTIVRSGACDVVPIDRTDWPGLPEVITSGIDAVLHLAWDLKTPFTEHPEAVFESNVMSTMRLLEASRSAGIAKFGLLSSGAVYGDAALTPEGAPTNPVTVNGLTKLLNERVAEAFCAAAGIECQVYRVFNMYGGKDRFSILSHLRRAIINGTPFQLNNGGTAERDFIHVEDVARIVATLLGQRLPFVHINIGTGRTTRIGDLVEAVRARHPGLAIEHRSATEARSSRADITRLTSILGEQRFVDVMDFVAATFAGGLAE